MHEVGRRSIEQRAPRRRSAILAVLALVAALLGVPATASTAGAVTTGTVTGSITVNGRTDVPATVVVCTGTVTVTVPMFCSTAPAAYATGTGSYSVQLDPGTYSVAAYVDASGSMFGGTPIVGTTQTVTVAAGATATRNLTVSVPGARGTVTVTGIPAGFQTYGPWVRVCPGAVTVTMSCVNGSTNYAAVGGTYTAVALTAGSYSLAAVYQYASQEPVVGPTTTLSLAAGTFSTANLTAAWAPLPVGQLTGTLAVTGTPAGATPGGFVLACPGATVTDQCVDQALNPSGVSFQQPNNTGRYATLEPAAGGTSTYRLEALTPGTWTLVPGYELSDGAASLSFASAGKGAVTGTPVTVNVTANASTARALSVPWLAGQLGRISGTVTKSAANADTLFGTVELCPGSGLVRTGCANGLVATFGPDGAYDILLPAGTWSIRVNVDGARYSAPPQETLAVPVDGSLIRNFTVTPVTPPKVQGTITFPAGTFSSVAIVACPGSQATITWSCRDSRITYASTTSGGTAPYSIELPPGTWSVGMTGDPNATVPATVVTLGFGETATRNFTYTGPTSSLVNVGGQVVVNGATAEQAQQLQMYVEGCPGGAGVTTGCAGGFTSYSYYTVGGACVSFAGSCDTGFYWSRSLPGGTTWSVRAWYLVDGATALSRAKVLGPTSVVNVPAPTGGITSTRADLSVTRAPTGTLTGTVTVVGRPASQLPITRVDACPGQLPPTSDCTGGVSRILVPLWWLRSSNSYSFELPAGSWSVRMRHSLNGRDWVSGNAVTKSVTVGGTAVASLTAPAQAVTSFDHTFTDVPLTAYYANAAEWMKLQGITGGIGGNADVYGPDLAVTRGQMAAFLWRLMGSPTGSPASGFTDVPAGSYYEEATKWLKARGITTGYGGDPARFAPDVPVTRSQMATFLWRLAGSPRLQTECTGCGTTSTPRIFSDVPSGVSYEAPVNWLWERGITTGLGSPSVFGPGPVVTRAQMAAFIYRLARDQGLA